VTACRSHRFHDWSVFCAGFARAKNTPIMKAGVQRAQRHRRELSAFQRECRGRRALCRGAGCPRKTSFLLFCAPPQAEREREKEGGAQPQTPGEGPPRPGDEKGSRPSPSRFRSRLWAQRLCPRSGTAGENGFGLILQNQG